MTHAGTALPIEDYALIGDCHTAALVGRNGSIDWLCLPRFDGDACFAALLGNDRHGSWSLAPAGHAKSRRTYREDSLVLETRYEAEEGCVLVQDFLARGCAVPTLVRIVRGLAGRVAMRTRIRLRFDYGQSIPWVTRLKDREGIRAIVGPDLVLIHADVRLHGEDLSSVARFEIAEGESVRFVLAHGPSHLGAPPVADPEQALADTDAFWRDFASRCRYTGPYGSAVRRSIITLRALTYEPTGGIAAAPTTSLPEQLGGVRNWDYRFCWLRDASLTLFALMRCGCTEEASAWNEWLQRSIAGSADQLQILYGLAGERRHPEWEAHWLPGYQGAAPVRIGNAAVSQQQLDVYGEVMACLSVAREHGLAEPRHGWAMQRGLIDHLEKIWEEPDEGIWETRNGREQFTFSKIMAWVAFDRMIADAETHRLPGPVEHWRQVRDAIHARVCRDGFNRGLNSFVQVFGSERLDASLLLIGAVGFLPNDDPRVVGTVAAIERDLLRDGFVMRYNTGEGSDGLPPGEGAFLACSFWLAGAYARMGRWEEGRALFERLLGLCNDLGLLSEEYDPASRRLTGNFPQAFSHVALVIAAVTLADTSP